jgi:hypothetical protein
VYTNFTPYFGSMSRKFPSFSPFVTKFRNLQELESKLWIFCFNTTIRSSGMISFQC